jgi:hypothetical protein
MLSEASAVSSVSAASFIVAALNPFPVVRDASVVVCEVIDIV